MSEKEKRDTARVAARTLVRLGMATTLRDLDVSELFNIARDVFGAIKRNLSEQMERKEFLAVDDKFANVELSTLYEVARALQSVCAAMGDRPPFARAEAIMAAIEYGNLERAAHGDGKVYAPTLAGVRHGLTDLIEAREHQMRGFVDKQVDADLGADFNTASNGIAVAFRSVRRERDAFVLARDYA